MVEKEKVVFQKQFPSRNSLGPIGLVKGRNIAVATVGQELRFFDTHERRFVGSLPLPENAWVTSRQLISVEEGTLHAGMQKEFVRIDVDAKTIKTLAVLPDDISNIAFAGDGQWYVTCGAVLYRLKR